jgi:hypothetical protein
MIDGALQLGAHWAYK